MQTATLYTLNSKVIPVYDHNSVRYLTEEVSPLPVKGEPPMYIPASLKEVYLPLHEVATTFRSIRGCPQISPPKPWKYLGSQEDRGARIQEDTYHHLFAVDPELENILWHVFNGEKLSGKISKLEQEKKVVTDKFDKANQKNYELGEKLKDALSANASLNERYLSTGENLFEIRLRVHNFCECNVFKRLWVAFRNDLTP